jgi:hypothetical protein
MLPLRKRGFADNGRGERKERRRKNFTDVKV